jgi:hypothetical protein
MAHAAHSGKDHPPRSRTEDVSKIRLYVVLALALAIARFSKRSITITSTISKAAPSEFYLRSYLDG